MIMPTYIYVTWCCSGIPRSELVLSSKISNTDLRAGDVRKAVEKSLNRLIIIVVKCPIIILLILELLWRSRSTGLF
jgi:hypothetical protein